MPFHDLNSVRGYFSAPVNTITQGLAAPLVAQKLLGTTGEYAILFLILMAVMSTGSAEVIAVASIIIYDVYQVRIHTTLIVSIFIFLTQIFKQFSQHSLSSFSAITQAHISLDSRSQKYFVLSIYSTCIR